MRSQDLIHLIRADEFYSYYLHCDARPRKELDEYRGEIERRIAAGQTHTQIRSWLATEGVRISKNTLSSPKMGIL